MAFSFIHISDIHLGRPFSGLTKYSINKEMETVYNNAVEKSLYKAVNFAIENDVDFVLFAGDTFDTSEQDFSSKLILKNILKKLDSNNIKSFLICGNHDPLISYNKNTFNYSDSSNIKIIGLNSSLYSDIEIYNKQEEKIAILHALSFKNKTFNENPLTYFKYPNEEDKKYFNIGLLHCDLNGDNNSPYAPCSLSDMKAFYYDYWALGHIHIPDINEERIKYAGTIQGRNTKETGAHGFHFVKVKDKNDVITSFISSDVIRYIDLDIDISDCYDDVSSFDKIIDNISSNLSKNEDIIYLLKINISGNIKNSKNINSQFIDILSQKIESEFNNSIFLSEITNNTSEKIEEELLKIDDGIPGELYRITTNTDVLNNHFNILLNQFENIIRNCDFDNEEFETFKKNIINNAKNECINICSYIYGSETGEN